MDIEEMVRMEHEELKAMMASLSVSQPEDLEQRKITLSDLVVRLADHEAAEERTFYRAMRDDERLREMALEGVEQHNIIEILLENLSNVDVGDELWLPKLRAMKNVMDNHMLVEERLLLPTARDILGGEVMSRLGHEFKHDRVQTKVSVVGTTLN